MLGNRCENAMYQQPLYVERKSVEKGWTVKQIVALVLGIILGIVVLGIVGIFIAAFTDPDESNVVVPASDEQIQNSDATKSAT